MFFCFPFMIIYKARGSNKWQNIKKNAKTKSKKKRNNTFKIMLHAFIIGSEKNLRL